MVLCNFSVRTLQCFQKKIKKFFDPEKFKKQASKVAHHRPRSFYFTVQPSIHFSYHEISGPDICSLICVWPPLSKEKWFFYNILFQHFLIQTCFLMNSCNVLIQMSILCKPSITIAKVAFKRFSWHHELLFCAYSNFLFL